MKQIIKKGDKYNKLTAIKFSHKDKKSCQFWLFRCDCGNEKVIWVNNVKRGNTKACGCLYKIHGKTKTETFKSWGDLRQRCLNKNDINYKNYGGRGITVCEEWLNFENFYKDMGDRPEGKSIDRINNDGNYCKENCRWATPKEQSNNRRSNHFITYKNKTQTISQWSEELRIKCGYISTRLHRGWSVKRALEL